MLQGVTCRSVVEDEAAAYALLWSAKGDGSTAQANDGPTALHIVAVKDKNKLQLLQELIVAEHFTLLQLMRVPPRIKTNCSCCRC